MKEHPVGAHCIICLNQVQIESTNNGYIQPSGGTSFTSHGHYGSTFFDSMNNDYIQLIVCDPCLVKRAKHLTLVTEDRVKDSEPTPYELTQETSEWVYSSAKDNVLYKDSPRILPNKDVLIFNKLLKDEETIELYLNSKLLKLKKDETFSSSNGVTYKLTYICGLDSNEYNSGYMQAAAYFSEI